MDKNKNSKMQNSKKSKKSFRGCCVIIFVLFGFCIFGLFALANWYNDAVYNPVSNDNSQVEIEIKEGDTLSSVADMLESEGLIKSKLALQIYIRQQNIDPRIKVGQYSIMKNINLVQLIDILEKGVFEVGIKITIKEGLRYETITDQLSAKLEGSFNKKEFLKIIKEPDTQAFKSDEVQAFLKKHKPSGKSLEGFLYPDTYEFAKDVDALGVVTTLVENFITRVNQQINLDDLKLKQTQITKLYDAIILASIIEKEASLRDDRAEVASVFHNRLGINMALQSDATVNYITGKNDAGVLVEDTKIDNPYNTYFYPGLPPGPINSPRIESIKAALYPKNTDFFFFFHDDAGTAYYSVTFEEHNAKVQQIRGSN